MRRARGLLGRRLALRHPSDASSCGLGVQAGRARRARHQSADSLEACRRIDHLSIHADDRAPFWRFLTETLELPVVVPPTRYALAVDHAPTAVSSLDRDRTDSDSSSSSSSLAFDLSMVNVGSGLGVEVFSDPSIREARRRSRLPATTIPSLALEPGQFNLARTAALFDRQKMRAARAPITYHFLPEDRAADPTLPAWLWRKLVFEMGYASATDDNSAYWAARASLLPPMLYTFFVLWHRDFAAHPTLWRRDDVPLPMGALGITACRRVFVSVPDNEVEFARLAVQWRDLNHSVTQPSSRELEIRFPAGPALHLCAETDPARVGRIGRLTGWECAVPSLEFAWHALTQRLPADQLVVLPFSTPDRLVLDLTPVGGVGLELHLVRQSVVETQTMLAAERALRRLELDGQHNAVRRLTSDALGQPRLHRVALDPSEGLLEAGSGGTGGEATKQVEATDASLSLSPSKDPPPR